MTKLSYVLAKLMMYSDFNVGPYGKKGDYTKIGLATRSCGENGWSGEGNTTLCAVKYTIPIKEAEEYFKDTNITDENAEEFVDTIKQV